MQFFFFFSPSPTTTATTTTTKPYNYSTLLLTLFITTIIIPYSPTHSYASMQLCSGYGSWLRGGAYGQMQISKYSTSTTSCTTNISPSSTTYSAGQQFTVTITSTSSYGYKAVAINGGTLSSPSTGGKLNGNTCVDWDRRSRSQNFKLTAPTQGGEIRVRALCGTNEASMNVASDIILQPGPDVKPPSTPVSTDPNYAFMQSLGTGLTLFFKKNDTHLDIKLQLDRTGYIGFGVGSGMVPSTAIIGMDPLLNSGYSGVGLYDLVSKTGSNAQIATSVATTSSTLKSYGIVFSSFSAVSGKSTLLFTVALNSITSKFKIYDVAGVDVIYAAGSSGTFGMHSLAGSILKINWATGINTGSSNGGASTVTPPDNSVGTTSSDPNYDYEKVLNAYMKLFYGKNNTHVRIKLTMTTQGWLAFGAGSSMIPATAVIGMDPTAPSNSQYPTVGVYDIISKSGTNNQIMTMKASTLSTMASTYGVVDTSFISTITGGSELKFAINLAIKNPTLTLDNNGQPTINAVYAGGGQNTYGMHAYAGVLQQISFGTAIAGSSLGSGFQVNYLLGAHIVGMIFCWLILSPIGVFMVLFKNSAAGFKLQQIVGHGGWFRYHWVIQSISMIWAYLFTLLGYMYVDDKKSVHWSSNHKLMGLSMLILSIAQPFMGHFRPAKVGKIAKDSDDLTTQSKYWLRLSFEWFHFTLGYTLLILGITTCILGVQELEVISGSGPGAVYSFVGYEDNLGFNSDGTLGAVVVFCTLMICLILIGGGGWNILYSSSGGNNKVLGNHNNDVSNSSGANNNKLVVDINLPTYTRAQVAAHGAVGDCWVIYRSMVYDVTKFLNQHPGGQQKILNLAGQEITTQFEDFGHSMSALGELNQLVIGRLERSTNDEEKPQATTNKNNTKTFLSSTASSTDRKKVQLVKKEKLSHNVWKLTFSTGNKLPFGLPCGKHIVMFAPVHQIKPTASQRKDGQWNGKPDSELQLKEIQRKYTPITLGNSIGSFTLVVKAYHPCTAFSDGGKMSSIFNQLKVPDMIEIGVKPVGSHEYLGNGIFINDVGKQIKASMVNLVAGGSGITPMYQIAQTLLLLQESTNVISRITLIFANSSVQDVFLQQELDNLEKQFPNRFKVWYTVSKLTTTDDGNSSNSSSSSSNRGSVRWKGLVGRISKEMFEEKFNLGSNSNKGDMICLVCGPQSLLDTAQNIWKSCGVDENRIVLY
jgi:cytochrome b involved in lipid metabolism/ferredoxin-NADP reductase